MSKSIEVVSVTPANVSLSVLFVMSAVTEVSAGTAGSGESTVVSPLVVALRVSTSSDSSTSSSPSSTSSVAMVVISCTLDVSFRVSSVDATTSTVGALTVSFVMSGILREVFPGERLVPVLSARDGPVR